MRCDDVFEILTRGPFPSGATTDESVERHLECCHECRTFAEALRPISASANVDGIPVYDGRLRKAQLLDDSVDLVERIQSMVLREDAQKTPFFAKHQNSSKGIWARLTIACCVACLLGVAVALSGPVVARSNAAAPIINAVDGAAKSKVAFSGTMCQGEALVQVKSNSTLPIDLRDSKDACCLTCHVASASHDSNRAAIGLVVFSCQKCHQEGATWAKL